MRQSRAEQAWEFAQRRGFAQKVENGHCSGGLSLRLRAFALALRGPLAISQIAVLSAGIDRPHNGGPHIMHFFWQTPPRREGGSHTFGRRCPHLAFFFFGYFFV